MSSSKKSFFLYFLGFFVFLGFYIVILALANAGLLTFSRGLTIPIRLLISVVFVFLFLFSRRVTLKRPTILFLVFAFFYLVRIGIDFFSSKDLYIGYGELVFYFLSFSLIPFVCVSTIKIDLNAFNNIRRAFFFSAAVFSTLAVFYLYRYIGTVGRFSSSFIGEEAISPLILSYCSSLIMGVSVVYLLTNNVNKTSRLFMMMLVVLSIVPFFLGASRGGLIALFMPFIVMYGLRGNAGARLKFMFFAFLGVVVLAVLAQQLGSGLFNRIGNLSEDIAQEDSSAIRVFIWMQSFNQFLSSPLIGDKLAVDGFSGYPHNIIFEVLQTTGILGFAPFLILLVTSLRKSILIFKNNPTYAWISVIFIQCVTQSMFSGAIYSSSWLWFSMALILSFPLQENKIETTLITKYD